MPAVLDSAIGPLMSASRIIRTGSLDKTQAFHTRHPLKPEDTDMYLHPLGEAAGLQRQMVTLARLPVGNESFLLHAHTFQEEFVFILEGTAIAVIGDEEHPVGPGDFVGYPCDGLAHQLRNTGDQELVYLMGGERTPFEIARFPREGKVGVFSSAGVTMYDEAEGHQLSFSDYLVKD